MVSKCGLGPQEGWKGPNVYDRDLNKTCPKDDFPLPHIDTLVDSAASVLCILS